MDRAKERCCRAPLCRLRAFFRNRGGSGSGATVSSRAPVCELFPAVVICFPELCACAGGGAAGAIKNAVELKPFAAKVGKLAREVGIALVIPCAERVGKQVFNSVPIVDSKGNLVLVYRKNYPTDGELRAGFSPGTQVPVGVCDGVRVG